MSIWQSFDPVVSARLLLIGLAMSACFLAALTWERRSSAPEAPVFSLILLCGAIYAFGYSGEVAATSLSQALFWLHVEYLALPFIPALWMLAALRHTGLRSNPLVIFAIPIVSFVAHFTNPWHHEFYTAIHLTRQGPFQVLDLHRGPFGILQNTYLMFAFLVAVWLYITPLRNGSHLFRKQALTMVSSATIPFAGYFLYLVGWSPWHLDMAPFTFPVCTGLYYFGMFRLGVFDLTPTARNLVFQGMRDAVLIIDNHSRLLDFNPAAEQLLPSLENASVGRPIGELLADYPSLLGLLLGACSGEILLREGGATRYFDVRAFPLLSGKRTLGHASILADITEPARLREELRTHAETDALTGIANRRRFLDSLTTTCQNAATLHTSLSLLLIDLDHFKSINDRFGHPTGDAVLSAVAGRLQSCLRAGDLLARYGGEEFSVLLPATDTGAGLLCAERVLAAVSAHPVTVDANQLSVTASIGLVTWNERNGGALPDITLLLKQADLALYRAKAVGRNCVVVAGSTGLQVAGSAPAEPLSLPTHGSSSPDAPAVLGAR